jgi:hypothetical protein
MIKKQDKNQDRNVKSNTCPPFPRKFQKRLENELSLEDRGVQKVGKNKSVPFSCNAATSLLLPAE